MKKFGLRVLMTIMLVSLAMAWHLGGEAASAGGGKLKIVTTIFPLYDWTRQILGDQAAEVELTMLLDKGVDLHSYQPTAEDMVKIAECDLFICVGGESDAWVDAALDAGGKENRVVVRLMDVLGEEAKEEELKEGMESDDDEHEREKELDEHVWLSLRNAGRFCSHIAQLLGELDPNNKGNYEINASAYGEKLTELDEKYRQAVENGAFHTLVFCDRFPFRYLLDDYGLDYYAAFAGCSAETEASFETMVFLTEKVNELGLKAVMVLEGTSHAMAQTVIGSTKAKNQTILALNSLQSVTGAQVDTGVTYLRVMESNLDVLKEALR